MNDATNLNICPTCGAGFVTDGDCPACEIEKPEEVEAAREGVIRAARVVRLAEKLFVARVARQGFAYGASVAPLAFDAAETFLEECERRGLPL